jgi:hypothetical protein
MTVSACRIVEDIDSRGGRPRAVEVGMINLKTTFEYYLSFCGFPLWILGLESDNVKRLVICKCTNFNSLVAEVHRECGEKLAALAQYLFRRIGVHKLKFQPQGPNRPHSDSVPAVHLISGSMQFLSDRLHSATTGLPTLALLYRHFSSRLHNGVPSGIATPGLAHVTWSRIRHVAVGGATTFCALLGSVCCECQPKLSILRRDIRSVVDFQVRPLPCKHPDSGSGADTTPTSNQLSDKLQVGYYDRPVIYPTSFSATGWGSRSLSLLGRLRPTACPVVLYSTHR